MLSEKPIAKDVATAQQLLSFYSSHIRTDRVSWSVAENYRFVEQHLYAASQIRQLGPVLGFRARFNRNIQPGSKYYETYWRKVPEYQGGFVLDAGVHFVAVLRLLLGSEEGSISKVSAFTSQLREHLPPVDTANATIKCHRGISGVFELVSAYIYHCTVLTGRQLLFISLWMLGFRTNSHLVSRDHVSW